MADPVINDSQVADDYRAGRAAAPGAASDAAWQQLVAPKIGSASPGVSPSPGEGGAAAGASGTPPAAAADQALPFGQRLTQALSAIGASMGSAGTSDAEGAGWQAIAKSWDAGAKQYAAQSQQDQQTHQDLLDGKIASDDPRVQDMHKRMVDAAMGLAFPGEALGGDAARGFFEALSGKAGAKAATSTIAEGGEAAAGAAASGDGAENAGAGAAKPAASDPASPSSTVSESPTANAGDARSTQGEPKPAFQFIGPDDAAVVKPTPELRAHFNDWANGVMGDNPVQASLAQIQDPKVMAETLQGVASFLPKLDEVPDETLRRLAYSSAMSPADVMAGLRGNLPDAQSIVAWSALENSGGRQLGALAQKAVESGAPEDWEAATRAFALQNHLVGEWTRAGNAQGLAFRARQIETVASDDYTGSIRDIIQSMGPSNVEDAIRKVASLPTPEAQSGFTSAMRWMGSRDGMLTGWYNYLLGPKTVVKKALTDVTMPLWNVATRYAAEKFGSGAVADGETSALISGYTGAFGDALRAAGRGLSSTGREFLNSVPTENPLGAVVPALKAGARDFSSALDANNPFRAAGRGLMAGRSQFMSDLSTMDGLQRTRLSLLANGAPDLANGVPASQPTRAGLAYLRAALPTSWIAGVDDFAKTFHYRAELRAQAWREGSTALADKDGNVDGAALGSYVNDALRNPSPAIHEAAISKAQELTFTEPLTGVAEKLADAADRFNIPIAGSRYQIPAGRIILPFARTPANFVRFMYRQSPLPLMFPSEPFKAEMARGGATRDLALAKIGLGTGLSTAVAGLAMGGMLNGHGPADPTLNAAWRDAGNAPYTVRLPGTRGATFPIEPFGMMFGAIGDTVDLMKYAPPEDADQLAMSLALGTGHAFLSRTYMQGLGDFMEAMQDRGNDGARWVDSLAASLSVPRTGADAAGALDPWLRAHYSMMSTIEARLPFVSKDLPFARDQWGDPIPLRDAYLPGMTGSGAAHMLSPIEARPDPSKVNPIDQWIWDNRTAFPASDQGRLGLTRPGMTQTYSAGKLDAHVRLTPEQLSRLQQLAGNGLKDGNGLGAKDTLNALVQGTHPDTGMQSEWNQSSPAAQAMTVLSTVSKFRGAAKQQLRTEYPDINDAVTQQLGDKAAKVQGAVSSQPSAIKAPTVE